MTANIIKTSKYEINNLNAPSYLCGFVSCPSKYSYLLNYRKKLGKSLHCDNNLEVSWKNRVAITYEVNEKTFMTKSVFFLICLLPRKMDRKTKKNSEVSETHSGLETTIKLHSIHQNANIGMEVHNLTKQTSKCFRPSVYSLSGGKVTVTSLSDNEPYQLNVSVLDIRVYRHLS